MRDRQPDDDLLHEAFANYAAAAHVVPLGADAVRTTVRRRRLGRAMLAGAVVAAVLVGSASAMALTVRRSPAPPTATAPPSPSVGPTPSVEVSPTPSSVAARAPVTDVEVRDATLTVTPLVPNCPAARVDFQAGVAPPGSVPDQVGVWRIHKTVPANLDGDPADEIAVLIDCRIGKGEGFEVVAVERDAAGQISTLGTVVVTEDGEFEEILDLERAEPAGVRVKVGNLHRCCVDVPERLQQQWRVYGWDGGRYAQIAGPSTFPPNPRLADLTVTVKPLVFGPVVYDESHDGWRYGRLSVTIRNNGPFPSPAQLISLTLQDDILPGADGWDACEEADKAQGRWCRRGALGPGQSYTLSLEFRIHMGFPLQRDISQTIRVTTPAGTSGTPIPDIDPDDNEASLDIRIGLAAPTSSRVETEARSLRTRRAA
jgi:hypothetical protein